MSWVKTAAKSVSLESASLSSVSASWFSAGLPAMLNKGEWEPSDWEAFALNIGEADDDSEEESVIKQAVGKAVQI